MSVEGDWDTVPWKHALNDISSCIREINTVNGWYDRNRTFGDDTALLHSEVSEAFEAYRVHGTEDFTHRGHVHTSGDGGLHCKPEGVGSELADVLIRLLDTCYRYDIDLGAELIRKLHYNQTRGYRHGGKLL